jgi:hypothetical protein
MALPLSTHRSQRANQPKPPKLLGLARIGGVAESNEGSHMRADSPCTPLYLSRAAPAPVCAAMCPPPGSLTLGEAAM